MLAPDELNEKNVGSGETGEGTEETRQSRRDWAGRQVPPPLIAGYAAAILSVTVATLIRLGLNPIWGSRFPYLVFFPAIVVAGLYGGLGPGLLSVALSAGSIVLFVLSLSGTSQAGSADDATGLTAFAVTGILLAAIAAAQR
ncbi:MAG: DUF4118 domain-containing protein, partial [Cytophagales bacterium]|nr:DUF4118 domain-containing protein [Armatimonadota bacterium]